MMTVLEHYFLFGGIAFRESVFCISGIVLVVDVLLLLGLESVAGLLFFSYIFLVVCMLRYCRSCVINIL
jgi:hypothetical protein